MCIASFQKIRSVQGDTAHMDDGRTVRLGPIKNARKGEYLEVYADIAVAKVSLSSPRTVLSSSRKRGSAFSRGGNQ